MYRATLIKGKTYKIGEYTFDVDNPDMRSCIVDDRIANLLAANDKFQVEKFNDGAIKKEIKNNTSIGRIIFKNHHVSKSEGYGCLGYYLMYKYPSIAGDIRDDLRLDDSLKTNINTLTPTDSIIQLSAGDLWENYKGKCKYSVGYTMFETTKIPNNPKSWADNINNTCDILLVPAEEVKKVFVTCGVKIPVYVVPLWVNDCYQYYKRPPRKLFKFLWVGKLDQFNRKGCFEVVEAFEQEFKKESDVKLIIKASNMNVIPEFSQRMADNPKIFLVNRILSREDLNTIYQEADCFVFPSHGEGFGLPPLEAMATGLPTIVADWMGCREFAKKEVCYPVLVDKLEKSRYPDVYGDVGDWAAIDIGRVRKAMRHVYENREEAINKGVKAARYVNQNFRFKNFDKNLKIALGLNIEIKYKVSIIMAVKDNVGYLKNSLASVLKFTSQNFELIIIDNGSGIEVKDFLKEFSKDKNVKIITNKDNMGYAYACNQGIQVATGEYLCMLDIDTIVTPGWMGDMINCMNKNEQCGVVVPSQSFLDDINYVPFKRNIAYAYIEDDLAEFSKTLKKGIYEEKQIREIYGYCHLVRREVFDNIGVYDWERYKGAAVNETDLFWRAQVVGWKLFWAKGAYVYHYHGVVKKSLGMDDYAMVEKGNALLSERQKHPEDYFVFNNAIVEGV